ncbi:WD40/YVTN/BNR-like repeat-containing protein [Methylobacterium sp. P5_C11]
MMPTGFRFVRQGMVGRAAVADRGWNLPRRLRQRGSSTTGPPSSASLRGLAVLLWSLAALTAAHAESYLWRSVKLGGGGFITGYSSDVSGVTRVVRADVYGAYIWSDTANRWVQLVTAASMPSTFRVQNGMNEGVYEVVVAPSDPRRIYLALKGRVFTSQDGGRSFAASSTAPFAHGFDPNSEFRNSGPFITVDPERPDVALFGTPADGLWRSEDAGLTWSRVPSVPPAKDLRPSQDGHQSPGIITWFEKAGGRFTGRVWAMSAGNGLFASSDGGRSFSRLPSNGQGGPSMLSQGAFARDGTFFGVDLETRMAWRYRAGAWQSLTSNGALPSLPFVAVANDADDARILIIDQSGTVFQSTDGGRSWTRLAHASRVGSGDPPWLRVSNASYFAMSRIMFDPVKKDRLWAGAGMGVFYADLSESPRTVTWVSQTRGIEELVANDVNQAPGQAPLFAVWDFGIHVKHDLTAYSTTYGPKERVLIAAQQVALTPANPRFVVTNASDTRTSCCSEDGDAVLAGYSLDGGESWTKFATLPTPPGTRPDDPWRMSFGTIAVSAGDPNNIVWEPTYNRAPFYTKDLGRSWQRVVLSGETLPFTGSHPHIYLSRKTLTADGTRPGVFYLVHSGEGSNQRLQGLWRTDDGGESWRQVFMGEIAPNTGYAAKLRAVPGRQGELFFTSGIPYATGTPLRRSRDGGETWSSIRGVSQVDDIAFGRPDLAGHPTIFISGRLNDEYGLWRSIDDGESWTKIGAFPVGTLDQVTVLGADADHFGRVYVGYVGSGFMVGEPADCKAKAYAFGEDTECFSLR